MANFFSISHFRIAVLTLYLIPYSLIPAFAQLQVTPSNNATQLAQTLAGNGVTISGATMNCPSNCLTPPCNPSGTFVGTSSNIGIAGGVLLTSGDVINAVGPNIQSSITTDNQVTINDPDLMAIDPNAIYDVCILEFNALPTCNTLAFTYAFGSDEYPEFVGSIFNDAYGIFVTGTNPSGPNYTGYNMALIPSTTTPVSINNVNNGISCPTSGPCLNCTYYVDNCSSGPTVEYDGFTTPVTVTLNVVPCSSYHFKLAVADAGDHAYDTGVFFAMQSLVCATSLTVTATSTNSTCTANNGTGTVTSVAGGQAPYSYTWSTTPPQNTQTATGLAPGTYTVTAIDANGCLSGTQTVTITGGGGFTATSNQTNTTCFGSNNASASVTPNGGTAPYTYAWSTNPVQTTPTISAIPAGNYTCAITDATGCVQTVTFTITQPPAVTGSITNSSNVSCFGGSNGSATASGSGGTGVINYSWNTTPTQAGATANNLSAGNYVVTITDANSCSVTQSVTITQPTGMTISTNSTPSSCGVKDGTATVTSSGGATPHTYLWLTTPVQSAPTATGLGAGTYTVIVTDANGCTQQQSIAVGGGMMPVADFFSNPTDVVSLLDPIVVFMDGSTGNPTIWSWNFGDTISGSNNVSSLQYPSHVYSDTGIYCITLAISDPTGICADTIVKCLRVEAPYTFYIPSAFTPNNDGWNDMFMGEGTYIRTFNIMIFDRWGNKIFESNDINKGWNGKVKSQTGSLVQEDVYVYKVEITDAYNAQHKYIGRVTMLK